LIGAGLLVAALVGGRWLAVETTERAWDRTFAGGDAIIAARDLARLIQILVALISVAWFTGNLFIVYRAIGSVQMPRRLGTSRSSKQCLDARCSPVRCCWASYSARCSRSAPATGGATP